MLYIIAFALGVPVYPAVRWAWQKFVAPKLSAAVKTVADDIVSKLPS